MAERGRWDVAEDVLRAGQDAVELREIKNESIVPQSGEDLDGTGASEDSAGGSTNTAVRVGKELIDGTGARAGISDGDEGLLAGCRVFKVNLEDQIFRVGAGAVDLELIEIFRREAVGRRSARDSEGIHAHREDHPAGVAGIKECENIGDVAFSGAIHTGSIAMVRGFQTWSQRNERQGKQAGRG